MSMVLSVFGKILLVSSACDVALSVCIMVRGCGCPSSISICRIEMAVFALMNRAPSSASAADDMTARIICEMLRTFVFSCHEHVASGAAAGFGLREVGVRSGRFL